MTINKIIFLLRKRLPEPIKKPLRWIYHKWNIRIDKDTLNFLKKYYNLPEKDVFRLLRTGGKLSADFWFCSNPKTEEEVIRFYEENPFYVFNLIFWHGTSYQRKLRAELIDLATGRVLDYGGGTGDLSLKLAQKGLKVDYADLQGKTFNFARSFLKENNLNINMINLSKTGISRRYDTIFCIDVIEHVKNPKSLLKNLVQHLKKDGRLIITALHPDISKGAPMHFEINFDAEEYLKSLGMEKTKEPFLWIKKF